MKLLFTISVLIIGFSIGCKSDAILTQSPELNFNSITVYKNRTGKDSMIIFSLNYKDGDGDIGLSEGDTLPPFDFGSQGFYNLLIDYFVKKNNQWAQQVLPLSMDTLNFNQRFQRLNNTNKKKLVSGTFDLRIPASPYPGILPDTIKLTAQIMDRGLKKSNLVETKAIVLKH